eukprot:scaffold464_cov181-Amphora_coffeaeformis.AAC.28
MVHCGRSEDQPTRHTCRQLIDSYAESTTKGISKEGAIYPSLLMPGTRTLIMITSEKIRTRQGLRYPKADAFGGNFCEQEGR